MKLSIEYHTTDERCDLYVVRIKGEKDEFTYSNFLATLERLKNTVYNGTRYVDVWCCNGYRLTATKRYFPNEVIEALYGEKILKDDWFFSD